MSNTPTSFQLGTTKSYQRGESVRLPVSIWDTSLLTIYSMLSSKMQRVMWLHKRLVNRVSNLVFAVNYLASFGTSTTGPRVDL